MIVQRSKSISRYILCGLLSIFGGSLLAFSALAQETGGRVAEYAVPDGKAVPDRDDTVSSGEGTEPAGRVVPEKSDSISGTDHPRQSPEQYTYAGSPRYTLTGKPPYLETHVEPVPTILTATSVAGVITGIHLYQQDAWWKDRRTDFHLLTDWGYAAQADKIGHFFAGYFTSYIGYQTLVASGFSSETAGWLGPLLAVGFQTYVEVEDGFSPFGFDPTDQVANVLGPAFLSAQNYVPFLQNFGFEWSYFPTDRLQTGQIEGHEKIVIDDYNGQTIWLSAKVSNFMPGDFWPEWLRLAAGYGAYNVDQWNLNENGDRVLLPAGRRYYLSLDYNLVDILPDLGTFGNWLVQTADFIHLPAPAIEFGPDVKFMLLYPIEF